MKILIINRNIGTGSVGRIVKDLYTGIIENNDECKLAYVDGNTDGIKSEDLYKICNNVEIKKHALFTRMFGKTSTYSVSTTRNLINFISAYKPDIIHVHAFYGYYINMEMLMEYISANNIYLISTLHSCWDITGHCCYFDLIGCDKWENGCFDCHNIKSYPRSYIDNTAYNFSHKAKLYEVVERCTIVVPSKWMHNLVRQSHLSKKHCKVIYNGIDLSKFNCGGKTKKDKIILSVGNGWGKRKGFDDLLELDTVLPEDIKLVVIGVTKKQSKMFSKNVVCIERTDSVKSLIEWYSKATVLFNPTYEDNYPTVNLEAIACHTPVATYDTGGSPETLKEMKYGKIIKRRDYVSLIEYVNLIHEGEIVYDFSNIYDISKEKMVGEYISLYNDIYYKIKLLQAK